MKVTIPGAIVKSIRTITPKDGKGEPFQVMALLDETGGDLDLSVSAEVDLSKVPVMLPLNVEMIVRPWKSGFNQRLSLTGISIQQKKGGE